MTEPFDPEMDSAEDWEEEEINSEEVEMVVANLEKLMENVESDTVYEYLQTAAEAVASLVEWDEVDDADDESPASEAA